MYLFVKQFIYHEIMHLHTPLSFHSDFSNSIASDHSLQYFEILLICTVSRQLLSGSLFCKIMKFPKCLKSVRST